MFEEGDADLMLSEIVRVTRPGGRIGVVVRAIDMPFWVNLPLDPALKAKVDAPGIIGGGMAPRGCADASLYRRFHALGLIGLKCFPQLVSVVPGQPRLERYQQQVLAALSPSEAETWRQAVAAAEARRHVLHRPGLSLRGRHQARLIPGTQRLTSSIWRSVPTDVCRAWPGHDDWGSAHRRRSCNFFGAWYERAG